MSAAVSARALALAILVEVEAGGWSDRLLAVREGRLADGRDRRFLHALVLATLRWQGAIDAVLAPCVTQRFAHLEPPVRAALRLAMADALVLGQPDAIAVDSTLQALKESGVARASGLVNAVLRRALRSRPVLDAESALPPWLMERWRAAHGDEHASRMARASVEPARPFVVALGVGRDALARELEDEGVTTSPGARHPRGLLVTRGTPQATAAFARGDMVAVNEAAALVAWLAAPGDGRPVVDLAAAPGGKAVLLANAASGPLVALEIHRGRAAMLRETLELRTPVGRALAVRADAAHAPLARGAFGTVLLDAPCSGTGTLRRRPEKRFRLSAEDIAQCATRQAALLDAAAGLVAPGGTLVYAVCSVEPEEGTDRVRAFLAGHPGFTPVDPRERLGAAAADLVEGDPPLLVTRPSAGNELDGFAAALLVAR